MHQRRRVAPGARIGARKGILDSPGHRRRQAAYRRPGNCGNNGPFRVRRRARLIACRVRLPRDTELRDVRHPATARCAHQLACYFVHGRHNYLHGPGREPVARAASWQGPAREPTVGFALDSYRWRSPRRRRVRPGAHPHHFRDSADSQCPSSAPVELGFRPDHLLSMRIDLHVGRTADQQAGYFEEAIRRASAIPGVQSAAGISGFLRSDPEDSVEIEGRPRSTPARVMTRSPARSCRPPEPSSTRQWRALIGRAPIRSAKDFASANRCRGSP